MALVCCSGKPRRKRKYPIILFSFSLYAESDQVFIYNCGFCRNFRKYLSPRGPCIAALTSYLEKQLLGCSETRSQLRMWQNNFICGLEEKRLIENGKSNPVCTTTFLMKLRYKCITTFFLSPSPSSATAESKHRNGGSGCILYNLLQSSSVVALQSYASVYRTTFISWKRKWFMDNMPTFTTNFDSRRVSWVFIK